MASTVNSFDTEHQGIIHDTKFDHYGKRLATAGLDGKIQIFEIINDTQKKVSEILGHESSVWQLSWSHPRFGSLLASCGFDKKVIIWKDNGKNIWDKLFEYSEHKNSVNCLAFAPQEYGLILLCGSIDGMISIHEYKNDTWVSAKIVGHSLGVNGVSWGPGLYTENEYNSLGTTLQTHPMQFVSCGNDNLIRVWQAKENKIDSFYVVTTLDAHDEVVRDVAWRNMKNSTYDVIVSGGDDNCVYLWVNTNVTNNEDDDACINSNSNNASEWKKFELRKFPSGVCKLSWDENGNHLAVTTTDGIVYIFKEQTDGIWDLVAMSNPEGVMEYVVENIN